MRLDVYSHGIAVTDITVEDRGVLFQFCRPLVQYQLNRVNGRMVKEPFKTFAGALKDRSEFRFHVNQLSDLLQFLGNHGYRDEKLVVVKHPLHLDDFPVVEHDWVSPYAPRDKQPGIIEHVMAPGASKMVALQTGKGKALADDTPVRVPEGWRRISALRVGDTVIDKDGLPVSVLGVYPQGEVQLYRVTFEDGRSVEACAEHLWSTYTTVEGKRSIVGTITTAQMQELYDKPGVVTHIPLAQPEHTLDQVLPLDPYVVGVILACGRMLGNDVILETVDKAVLYEVGLHLPPGNTLSTTVAGKYLITGPKDVTKNAVYLALCTLNLAGFVGHQVMIPLAYRNGSEKQRTQLLQGLFDVGAAIENSGKLTFRTDSATLAKDVQYVVRAMGGIAALGDHATHTSVTIKMARSIRWYFRTPSKVKVSTNHAVRDTAVWLGVTSIVPTRVGSATCIAVDSMDKLYVVKDFIVTHNTFIAMWCTKLLSLRTAFIFKGGYVDRWHGDLEQTFNFEEGELLVVRGAGGLIRLMDDALDGSLDVKCIIITNRTMYDYLKDHENTNGQSELYPVPADKFYEVLGIGFRVIDEVHQEFHFNYRQDLYTHTLKSLSLSATLNSNDRFMNMMYDIAYPVNERNDGGGYHAYINATALMYRLSMPKLYRFKGAQGGYSHNAFEKSMMSKKDFFPKYLKIFEHVVRVKFFDVMEKGQKMLIFCASVDMCTIVQKHLEKAFPTLVIGRYTQEDDYSVLEESDVTVSTVLSAGTAVDIPNLRITFMSTAIDSRQSNEQALGRTRELKDWPKISPEFLYLVCEDVEKHVAYHERKKEYFRNKVLSHNEMVLPITV